MENLKEGKGGPKDLTGHMPEEEKGLFGAKELQSKKEKPRALRACGGGGGPLREQELLVSCEGRRKGK